MRSPHLHLHPATQLGTESYTHPKQLHTLHINQITQVTPTVRLFQLSIPAEDRIEFLPGQWVDLYPPSDTGIVKPGGFTITSAPSAASSDKNPYIELAIQYSPENPVAAYLFRPAEDLLHTPVSIRVGGSFVFPPPPVVDNDGKDGEQLQFRKVVFVAGGMGINPMMSMLSHIAESRERYQGLEVRLLYTVKEPTPISGAQGEGHDSIAWGVEQIQKSQGILFLDRIAELFTTTKLQGQIQLFLTGGKKPTSAEGRRANVLVQCGTREVPALRRRMAIVDVEEAIGSDKDAIIVYICGVPTMTDEFVEALVSPGGFGMEQSRVLCEKWW